MAGPLTGADPTSVAPLQMAKQGSNIAQKYYDQWAKWPIRDTPNGPCVEQVLIRSTMHFKNDHLRESIQTARASAAGGIHLGPANWSRTIDAVARTPVGRAFAARTGDP